jgi:hypothetical protein
MGIVHVKPKKYNLISSIDASDKFSAINIGSFQPNNGMPLQSNFQGQQHWNRVFAADKRGRRSATGDAKEISEKA